MTATLEPPTLTHEKVSASAFRKEHGIKHTPLSIIGGFFGALLNALPIYFGALIFTFFASMALQLMFGINVGTTAMMVMFVATAVGGVIYHWVRLSILISTPAELRETARLELYPKRAERKALQQAEAVKKVG